MTTVWTRSKSKIYRLLGKAPKSTPRFPFPYEIVEMIIAYYLAYSPNTLKACSLTCRSWYNIAAPLLHHTLTIVQGMAWTGLVRLEQLPKLHELGLLRFVKKLRIRGGMCREWFVSRASSHLDLRYFSTLANVHTLELYDADIYSFIPGVELYFKHFSPTLRSIALLNPRCTPRQLSHFLSLFKNLDDIEIRGARPYIPDKTIPDMELVPFSTPKLQGKLVLRDISWVEPWIHFISFSGGLRFNFICLPWSGRYTSILLEACAETLETVRLETVDGKFCIGSSTDLS